jgi:hypothetical protein
MRLFHFLSLHFPLSLLQDSIKYLTFLISSSVAVYRKQEKFHFFIARDYSHLIIIRNGSTFSVPRLTVFCTQNRFIFIIDYYWERFCVIQYFSDTFSCHFGNSHIIIYFNLKFIPNRTETRIKTIIQKILLGFLKTTLKILSIRLILKAGMVYMLRNLNIKLVL